MQTHLAVMTPAIPNEFSMMYVGIETLTKNRGNPEINNRKHTVKDEEMR